MYCSKCGQKQIEGALFCQKCGSRVAEQMAPIAADEAAQLDTVVAIVKTDTQTLPQSGLATPQMPPNQYTAPETPPNQYAAPQMPPNQYAVPQMPPNQYAAPMWQEGLGLLPAKSRKMSKGLFITITSLCAAAALLLGIWIGTSIAGVL